MCRRYLASIRLQLGLAERSRTNRPILGAAMAEEIIHALDCDYGQFKLSKNLIISAALRAKKLDEVASAFASTTGCLR
jgi:hypothetical protein